jgi:hypothetical protein
MGISKRSADLGFRSAAFCCRLGDEPPRCIGALQRPDFCSSSRIHNSPFTIYSSQISAISCQSSVVSLEPLPPRTPSSAMAMERGLTPFTTFLSRRRRRSLPYYSQEGRYDR